MDQSKSSPITLPAAIIIAGALIAVSIIWVKKPANDQIVNQGDKTAEVKIRQISANDHILGNPGAQVKIVEYSDASCPFCKTFNETMVKIMDEYGPSGKVAWVYRHFPIDKPGTRPDGGILHPNAGNEAQAMECAAFLGGNEKFWAFEKRLYEVTPSVTSVSPEGLDQKLLPEIAEYVGLDKVSFNECLTSGEFKAKVEADYLDGVNAGASGTPYSIIVTSSGGKIPLVGAQPYPVVKNVIEAILSESAK